MSQITRCPSCATSFKVVADQLRISEGWVRCGKCAEIFDAAAHLQAPPSMLPGVSLTDVRPPPAPVAAKVPVAAANEAAPRGNEMDALSQAFGGDGLESFLSMGR